MLKIYLFLVKMPQCCVQISMLILPFSSMLISRARIFFFYYSREEEVGWDGKGRDVMGRDGMGREGMAREGKGQMKEKTPPEDRRLLGTMMG